MVCRESLNVSFMVNKSSIFMLPVTLSVANVVKVADFRVWVRHLVNCRVVFAFDLVVGKVA